MALWNFSWVIPNKLAGSSLPGGYRADKEEYILSDLREMHDNGVRCLISLQRMDESFGTLCTTADLLWIHYPLNDYAVPGDMQTFSELVDTAIDHMNNNRPVCVHCQAGIGRTGLTLASIVGAYLKIDAALALQTVRKNRLAMDTENQEMFVHEFLKGNRKA